MTKQPNIQNIVHKEQIIENLAHGKQSALKKYAIFFSGQEALIPLLKYELITSLAGPMPGGLGFLFRKALYPMIMAHVGKGVNWGMNVALRHPFKMDIGNRTAIDDFCLLDARGVKPGEFKIGCDVLIARNCVVQAKTDKGFIDVGDYCTVGDHCTISSSGGVRVGKYVGIAGHCFIGGGRYRTNRADGPMMKQDVFTHGPVDIGDDCWIGMGARILDGVKIGRGSIVGAGVVVREDIPEYTIVTPHQRLIMIKREFEV